MAPAFFTSCLISAWLLFGDNTARPTTTPPVCDRSAAPKLKTVTYSVADLVVPTDDHFFPEERQGQQAAGDKLLPLVRAANKTCEDRLIRLILTTIAPQSWSDYGGPGTLQYYPLGQGLVIKQSRKVHEQIGELLAGLRRLQDLEVAVEIRLIEVSDCFEQIVIDFDSIVSRRSEQPAPGAHQQRSGSMVNSCPPDHFLSGLTPAGTFTPDLKISPSEHHQDKVRGFLDDRQVHQLLETCQGDRRTNCIQAPRVTVFNGQRAAVGQSEQKCFLTGVKFDKENNLFVPQTETVALGWRFAVRPTVAADRRLVHLNLFASQTTVDANVPLFPLQIPLAQQFQDHFAGKQPVVFQMFIQQPTVRKIEVQESLDIPDGKTAVLYCGTTLSEERNEFGPPVLSSIPYLNRLFKNVAYGRETKHQLLLVTPRIIVMEEEEQIFLGNVPPLPRP